MAKWIAVLPIFTADCRHYCRKHHPRVHSQTIVTAACRGGLVNFEPEFGGGGLLNVVDVYPIVVYQGKKKATQTEASIYSTLENMVLRTRSELIGYAAVSVSRLFKL